MITEAFYAHLKADSGVMAIAKSISPHIIPAGSEPPAITYSVDEDGAETVFDGPSSLSICRMSVDCWSKEYLQCHELSSAVESALINYAGDLGSQTPAITADHIRLERKFDLFESPTELYRVSLQFYIAYY